MQLPISDPIAITFSYWFYWALARGRTVDWAITRARKAMRAAAQGLDWAIPVLFLSTPDGQLFRWKPSPSLYASLALIGLFCAGFLTWSWWLTSAAPPPAPPSSVNCPSPRALPDMKFVLVHGGSFQMGSDSGEKDEKPVHQVTISRPFCLGAYEVTQEQWQTIMGDRDLEEADRPAQSISYMDALDFIRKLNDREGKPVFRLPREAEWEFAAQDPGELNCDTDLRLPVGSLKPNRYGLHGMLGNVWEWVEDWYGEYPAEPVTDPSGPATGEKRIKRGGSSDTDISNCRASRRNSSDPARHQQNTGFRILREIRK
jgi:formylglycine-generating enzyme required for sulfatase activity